MSVNPELLGTTGYSVLSFQGHEARFSQGRQDPMAQTVRMPQRFGIDRFRGLDGKE
jgi:hypothetical protein